MRRFSFGIIWSRDSKRLEPPGLDDRVAAFHPLDGPGHQLVATREKIIQDLLALRIANALEDDLLGRLRADAPKFDRFERFLDEILELEIRVPLLGLHKQNLALRKLERFVFHHLPAAKRLEVAGRAIDRDAHVDVVRVLFLRR